MLVLARFMRLKALDKSQTNRGSVARYTSTALELRKDCGRCPTAVRPTAGSIVYSRDRLLPLVHERLPR